MNNLEMLKREIDAEDGTFLITLRCELCWDWDAFHRLTSLMYKVAEETKKLNTVDKHIAEGYWFIDTWVKYWTGHENFPRPEKEKYDEALVLLHDLCSFFFMGVSPYTDDTLKNRALKDM